MYAHMIQTRMERMGFHVHERVCTRPCALTRSGGNHKQRVCVCCVKQGLATGGTLITLELKRTTQNRTCVATPHHGVSLPDGRAICLTSQRACGCATSEKIKKHVVRLKRAHRHDSRGGAGCCTEKRRSRSVTLCLVDSHACEHGASERSLWSA